MSLTPEEQAEWNQNRQPLLYGVLSVLLALSNTAVALRIYVALKRWGRLKPDDYCMIGALVMSDGVVSSLIYATTQGFGLHVFRVVAQDGDRPWKLIHVLETVWAYAVMNGSCFMTIKLAILLSYRRLFFRVKWFRMMWWFNLTYAILWTIGSTLFYVFQCRPIDYYWTRVGADFPDSGIYVNPHGHCVVGLAGTGAPIILNTVGDLLILVLPAPILFQLQVTNLQRVRLMGLFSFGLIAVAAGFVRFAEIFKANDDYTWTTVEFVIWSTVEQVVGIVCANLPMVVIYFEDQLHKYLHAHVVSSFSSEKHSSSKHGRRLSLRAHLARSSTHTARVSARFSSGSRGQHSWFINSLNSNRFGGNRQSGGGAAGSGHLSELDEASRSGSETSTVVESDLSEQVTPADSWEKEEVRRSQNAPEGEINVTRTVDVRSVSH